MGFLNFFDKDTMYFFSKYSMLLPFILGLITYKYQNSNMRIFFYIICTLVGFEFTFSVIEYFHFEKFWLFNIAFLYQALILGYFFYQSMQTERYKFIVKWSTIIFMIVWIVLILLQGIRFTNSYIVALSNLTSAFACALYMYECVSLAKENVLYKPEFIVAFTFLIYCCMAGIIFSLLDHQPRLAKYYPNFSFYRNYIHYFVNTLTNILFTYSFVCLLLKRKSYLG